MNTDFYISLKHVGIPSSRFPNALERLELDYNELIRVLREYQLSKPKTLMRYCINRFNQITKEQSCLHDWYDFLRKKEIKDLPYAEIELHEIELNYYREVLTISDDARTIILEYIAAYSPVKLRENPYLMQELIKLAPSSIVVKSLESPNSARIKTRTRNYRSEKNQP